MKKQLINISNQEDRVRSFFVAKHKQLEYFRDRTKGRFLTLVLADRSGTILARAWDNGSALYEQFEENDVIAVQGQVDEYLGRQQIIILKLRPVRPDDKDKYYSDDDFVPQTDKDIDKMWADVGAAAASIGEPHIKTLVESILADPAMAEGLRSAPASKLMHHSYRGGLLEHIVEMLSLSSCLTGLYPRLDHDLLIAGIILHDLGLVEGSTFDLDIDYSDAGRLVGPVVLGDRIVTQRITTIPDFPPDLALSLGHMILTHNGEAQFGAVRQPQTLEAMALYLLHKVSAELNHVEQVFAHQQDMGTSWTEYDRMTDRSFFRGRSLEPAPAPDGPPALPPASPASEEQGVADLPNIAERQGKYNTKGNGA